MEDLEGFLAKVYALQSDNDMMGMVHDIESIVEKYKEK